MMSNSYLNVHTSKYPDGAIRGQLLPIVNIRRKADLIEQQLLIGTFTGRLKSLRRLQLSGVQDADDLYGVWRPQVQEFKANINMNIFAPKNEWLTLRGFIFEANLWGRPGQLWIVSGYNVVNQQWDVWGSYSGSNEWQFVFVHIPATIVREYIQSTNPPSNYWSVLIQIYSSGPSHCKVDYLTVRSMLPDVSTTNTVIDNLVRTWSLINRPGYLYQAFD